VGGSRGRLPQPKPNDTKVAQVRDKSTQTERPQEEPSPRRTKPEPKRTNTPVTRRRPLSRCNSNIAQYFEKSLVRTRTEELRYLYSSPSIIGMIKSRRIRWAGYAVRLGSRGTRLGYLRDSQRATAEQEISVKLGGVCLIRLIFHSKTGGNTFLRNVYSHKDYRAQYPRRW
jgi:hypothetical protein